MSTCVSPAQINIGAIESECRIVPGSQRHGLNAARSDDEIDWNQIVPVTFSLASDTRRLRQEADCLLRLPIRDRAYYAPDELKARYPPEQIAVEAVESFAAKNGLAILPTDPHVPLRHLMVPLAQTRELFGTDLFTCRAPDNRLVRGRTGPVSLHPRYFDTNQIRAIRGVFGLDNPPLATRRPAMVPGQFPALAATTPAAYDFPAHLQGDAQTIGILEFGGSLQECDLARVLGLHSGQTNAHVVSLDLPGAAHSPRFLEEASTDGQIVRRILPNATIVFYVMPDTDQGWITGMHHILSDTTYLPSVLSISWGYFEIAGNTLHTPYWTPSSIEVLEDAFARAALLGITVCCCSGDEGVGSPGPRVYYPASSQYLLTCGGTKFSAEEQVWCDPSTGGSSGGGISRLIPMPDWQDPTVVRATSMGLPQPPQGAPAMRLLPDVAASALATITHWGAVAGTSVAAPLWAALIGAANQQLQGMNLCERVGNLNALLYDKRTGLQDACTDIVAGSNGAYCTPRHCYVATPGWDACTGWGSPVASKLIAALVKNATRFSDLRNPRLAS
jgi:kumamolisin